MQWLIKDLVIPDEFPYYEIDTDRKEGKMFFWLIVGVALGYFFRPQINGVVQKAVQFLKDSRKDKDDQDRER